MLRLLCIRHAQSTWNALGRWQGQADPPLSELGRLEAKALAQQLRREAGPLAGLVTSDLSRARETAALLAETLELVPEPWPALREADVGLWSGRVSEEIARLWPEDYARFRAGDPELRPGGGESRCAVRARARAAVRALEQRFGAAKASAGELAPEFVPRGEPARDSVRLRLTARRASPGLQASEAAARATFGRGERPSSVPRSEPTRDPVRLRLTARRASPGLQASEGVARATFGRGERPSSVPGSEPTRGFASREASEAVVRVAVVTHLGWLRALRPGIVLATAGTLWLDSAELVGSREEQRP